MIEQAILIAVFSAAIYALSGYLKSVGEAVDGVKAVATIIIGGVIGAILYASGIPITEQAILVQMGTYAGLTAVVENALKILWRRVRPLLGEGRGR